MPEEGIQRGPRARFFAPEEKQVQERGLALFPGLGPELRDDLLEVAGQESLYFQVLVLSLDEARYQI